MGDCLQTHEICQLYENNSTQLRIASNIIYVKYYKDLNEFCIFAVFWLIGPSDFRDFREDFRVVISYIHGQNKYSSN